MFLVIDIVVLSYSVLTYCFLFLLSFPVIPLSLFFLSSFSCYSFPVILFLLFFSCYFFPVISFLLFLSSCPFPGYSFILFFSRCFVPVIISFLFFPFPLFSGRSARSASAGFRAGSDAAALLLHSSSCFLTSSLSQERVVPDAGSSSVPAGTSSGSSASPESAEKSSP